MGFMNAAGGDPVRLVRPSDSSSPSAMNEVWREALELIRGASEGGLPFMPGDATAGSEAELQAAVAGDALTANLPCEIRESDYFSNIVRRTESEDMAPKKLTELERWIESNRTGLWENSWVRFPIALLYAGTRMVLEEDLLFDRSNPDSGWRTDRNRFIVSHQGVPSLRIPVSYLLKIALTDATDPEGGAPQTVAHEGRRLRDYYLSDNTSPENSSFHVALLDGDGGMGQACAGEAAKRYLLTQLLVAYANEKFGLSESGQQVVVFSSPHPPLRQKELNRCVSDSFYRDLFMNPCLAGWQRGEEKQAYMHLCHQVLSRSHLNAIAKLREAGIVTNNLVVLPSTSNISLANNGTHISLGSRLLDSLRSDPSSGFSAVHEKCLADLAIKIVEHFLPLFVGTYSAAPRRLDFTDFHPETALGFLPHELDYTHLRMLWRRWRGKARLKVLGRPLTPFGPVGLDRFISTVLRLKGDYVTDYRLIDYLVALLSTDRSPAFNGELHNHDRLKKDLTDMGVFDRRMSLYSFIKNREYDVMGFSGFEGRFYSLFPGFDDMASAVNLQALLLSLAYQYMMEGVGHGHIPDLPFVESERRQIIFGAAVDIPTFYIRRDSVNPFLGKVLSRTEKIRQSRRYPGYLRVYLAEYRLALVRLVREEGRDLVERFGMEEQMADLEERVRHPGRSGARARLTEGILAAAGVRSPLAASGDELNGAAEEYYRNDLRKSHLQEAYRYFEADIKSIGKDDIAERQILKSLEDVVPRGMTPEGYLDALEKDILRERACLYDIRRVIGMLVLSLRADRIRVARRLAGPVGMQGREALAI